MSTGPKRKLGEAMDDAMAFRALFDGYYTAWYIAGSVRRGKPEVGDVEHVVIGAGIAPRMDELLPDTGLFPRDGTIEKAIYPDGRTRWGERYRGCMFRGFRHEVFIADARNLGCILTIRTGPAEFSERMVTALKQGGQFRQQDGYLMDVGSGQIVDVPDEQTFFRLCGYAWIRPEQRQAVTA